MSFKDRRERIEKQPEIIVEKKPEKEIPTYKKLILKKNSKKATRKLLATEMSKEVKEIKPKDTTKTRYHSDNKTMASDTKLALIGTTETANNFRAIVKKKRLTITEVLEDLLTFYTEQNKKHLA